mmetsp:Transcript_146243/g.407384  ORF Transcript_146243/g.407384 Transcript_146243/m.407384 type:complete len:214 (+) Transcript_146243:241-882(+)
MQIGQGRDVERREGMMPSRALCEAVPPRLKRLRPELPRCSAVPHQPCALLEQGSQATAAALAKRGRLLPVPEVAGRSRRRCVCKREIQRSRACLTDAYIHGDVTILDVMLQAVLAMGGVVRGAVLECILPKRLPRGAHIETRNVLQQGVRNDHVRERADHAVAVARARPLRKPTTGTVGVQPALQQPTELTRVGQRQKGVDRAEGVPEAVVGH